VPFRLIVPRNALSSPAPILQYGHGLGGSAQDLDALTYFLAQRNYVGIAVDWGGLSADDLITVAFQLSKGMIGQLHSRPDRASQAISNALLAMRTVSGALARDPQLQSNGQPVIKTSERYYMGASLGGILGGTYMALTPDVQRGWLTVPGQPLSAVLNRS